MTWLRSAALLVALALSAAGCLPSKDPYVYNFQTLTGQFSSEAPHVYNVHTVVPGLLVRGGQPTERGLIELRDKLGITTVVNLNDITKDSEAKLAARAGLAYVPLPDNPFDEADDRRVHLGFLRALRDQDRRGPIYVHCKTGTDRTGLAIGIYRIVECGWDASHALAELRQDQPYWMAVFFHHYPAILRDAERHRDEWLRALGEAPDPPAKQS
jgi:protein tyrosine phosphatase (PTP) superfamily phosphohydrolase (DUF442 family)